MTNAQKRKAEQEAAAKLKAEQEAAEAAAKLKAEQEAAEAAKADEGVRAPFPAAPRYWTPPPPVL